MDFQEIIVELRKAANALDAIAQRQIANITPQWLADYLHQARDNSLPEKTALWLLAGDISPELRQAIENMLALRRRTLQDIANQERR